MVRENIVASIRQQQAAGVDKAKIKSSLLSYGFRENEISEAFAVVEQHPTHHAANPQLIAYVKQQKAAGYNKDTIKTQLLQSGYDQATVDNAINEVFASKAFHIRGGDPIVWITIIVFAMLILGGIIFLFTGGEEAAEVKRQVTGHLGLRLDLSRTSVNVGDNLLFVTTLTGVPEDETLTATYYIFDQHNNEINFKRETVSLTRGSSRSSIEVPTITQPGTYTLETSVKYNTKTLKDSTTFTVTSPVTVPELPTEAELPTAAAPTEIEGPPTVTIGLPPPEAEEQVRIEQYYDNIKQLSANPQTVSQAESLCPQLTLQRDKDTCYLTIVEISKKQDLCTRIHDNYRRDVCYLAFVLEGDYSVCDTLVDEDLRISCRALGEKYAPKPEVVEVVSPYQEILDLAQTDLEAAKGRCYNETQKDACFYELAISVNDLSICDFIQDTYSKDQCLHDYAINNNDNSICTQIQDLALLQDCDAQTAS